MDTPGTVPRPARWEAARPRFTAWTAAGLALVVLVTSFVAALLPRADAAYRDHALRRALAAAPPAARQISLTLPLPGAAEGTAVGNFTVSPAGADQLALDLRQVAGAPLPFTTGPDQDSRGERAAEDPAVTDTSLPRPSPDLAPHAAFIAQRGVPGHARLLSGRWPRPAAAGATSVEAAVTEGTAAVMRLRTGSVVHLLNGVGAVVTVRITGVAAARGPRTPYWLTEPSLLRPELMSVSPVSPGGPLRHYWDFGLLMDSGSGDFLFGLGASGPVVYAHRTLDVSRMDAASAGPVLAELASLTGGAAADRIRLGTGQLGGVVQQLDALLSGFQQQSDAVAPVVEIAIAGAASVALVALLMAAGLAADRRRTELVLLRARGAGPVWLGVRLLAESAVLCGPTAVAGTAAALLVVPGGRWGPSVALGAAVGVLAALALPLRSLAVARTSPVAAAREDLAAERPSPRRTVVELTLAVLLVGALAAVRARGAGGAGDPLTATAPVLLAVVGAIVLLRLYPLPLRLLDGPAGRTRGVVAVLGVARAGRTAGRRLPAVAALVAVSVASFGGCVLSAVSHARAGAALASVGADARVDEPDGVPASLGARIVRDVPGARGVVAVRVESGLRLPDGRRFDLVVVDPASYARQVRLTGLGAPFPAAALRPGAPGGAVPAVVSAGLARVFGGDGQRVAAQAGTARVRTAAVARATPATSAAGFVVVSSAAFGRALGLPAGSPVIGPTTLLVNGPHPDARRLAAVVRGVLPYGQVSTRAAQLALYDQPLQAGAARLYAASTAAGAVLAVLALLLDLAGGAPQRAATLAGLRTMGLARARTYGLMLAETLPQVLVWAAGGVLVALAAVRLTGGEVALRVLTFGTGAAAAPPPGTVVALRADPLWVAAPAVVLLLVAGAVAAAQAAWSARRGESTWLRAGERS